MVLFSLVASHHEVDLETIARLSTSFSEVASTLSKHSWVSGVIPLSTCNRLELYIEVAEESDVERTRRIALAGLAESTGIPAARLESAFQVFAKNDAVHHLFAVSAGLESAVVGEREIAGQVRRAHSEAQAAQLTSKPLSKLFQSASKTAKEVGAQTSLGERGRSIVSVALDLADDLAEVPLWADRRVVIIGTGAYAGATVALLRERGAANIGVFSSSGRAAEFAAKRGIAAVPSDELDAAISSADVLIGCSGGDFQVQAASLAAGRSSSGRGARQLTVIDLALTHDFEPAVGQLPGVDMLTLESVRMAAPLEQAAVVEQARDIVDSAVEEFAERNAAREIDSAIVALRSHTMQVLDAEMAKVRAQHGCTAAAEEVEFALRRMMRQFLHIPTVRARELAAEGRGQEYVDALESLFGLEVGERGDTGAHASEASCPVDAGAGAGADVETETRHSA